jgi:hypothetical protein
MLFKNFNGFLNEKKLNNDNLSTTTTTITSIQYETRKINNEGETYIINVSYPYFNIAFIDDNISSFINKSIDDFKSYTESPVSSSYKNMLDIVYDIYLVSDNIISIRFIDAVYTGGAHGSQQVATKNFDLKTGREMQLKYLFKNDSYIEYISDKAIEKLNNDNVSEIHWIQEGAGPKYSNFENFTYGKNGDSFIFHFNPYQVAPYSEGIITFELPIKKLKDFLR